MQTLKGDTLYCNIPHAPITTWNLLLEKGRESSTLCCYENWQEVGKSQCINVKNNNVIYEQNQDIFLVSTCIVHNHNSLLLWENSIETHL